MNRNFRITKLEEIAMPQKTIVRLTDMERAVRIVYLLDQAQRGKTLQMDMRTATRIVDLLKLAAERRKQM
jgi:hypothetical protein